MRLTPSLPTLRVVSLFSRSKRVVTIDDAHRAVDAATRPYTDVDLYGLAVGERALENGAYIIRAMNSGNSRENEIIAMVIALGVDRY